MKIQISFVLKKLELYLMKIQINFVYLKEIRSTFNENTDQFCVFKKIKSVFNKNTDEFCVLKVKSEKFK